VNVRSDVDKEMLVTNDIFYWEKRRL